ncbi:MAG: hypothetical protein E7326_01050 [Clostridiales bacterium]|nr:hypothetical protein [Clostridiales bacterium]
MKATDAVQAARDILKDITPLKTDCGRVCGAACCAPDETGKGGMLLFPGEEKLYDVLPEGFEILPDDSVVPDGRLLVCKGRCDRDMRPLSCMFFPLRPTFRGDVRMDRRGLYVCPLAEYGVGGLNPEFVDAARSAAQVLAQQDETREYLRALGAHIKKVLEESRL